MVTDKKFPHIIIDKTKTPINIGYLLKPNQAVSIDSEFNSEYKTYCREKFKLVIASIVTPRLRKILLSFNKQFDVEFVGN
jgi:hypothetical protein